MKPSLACVPASLVVAALLLAGPAAAQQTDQVTVPFTDPSRPGLVTVTSINGTITVHAANRRDVLIETRQRPDRRGNRAAAGGLRRLEPTAGFEVVETDLGEYVVQLDGDRPSHVIAPIIHKTQGEVRELFSRVAGHELGASAQETAVQAPETLVAPPLGGDLQASTVLMLDFKWAPDLWGGKRAAWQAALGQARAAEIEARAARIELSSNVARAYVQLGYAYTQQDLAKRPWA